MSDTRVTEQLERLRQIAELDANESLDKPRWADCTRVHDWRSYVPDSLKDLWPTLPVEARLCLYVVACVAADREEWD